MRVFPHIGPLVLTALAACQSSAPTADIGVDLRVDRGGDRGPPDRRVDAAECPVSPASGTNVVATSRGLVRGASVGGTIAWRGIPYAEPPTGSLRFAAPVPRACWSGVRDALDYGSRCPQRTVLGVYQGDEDCLSLNVWTPALPGASSSPLPVLFFIHGGANIIGASNEGASSLLGDLVSGTGNLYDGQILASKQKVVVVSVNYRLGPLGFLAHPALSQQSPTKTSGNYAILDLVAALQWTQKNIAAFGGDPQHVMVFGESAGAANTCMLLVSPLAKGLFQAALMESGGCQAPALSVREAAGQKLAVKLGCGSKPDVAACLRAAPPGDMIESLTTQVSFFDLGADILRTWDLPYGANVDGVVIPEPPMKVLREGKHNPVPFVIGSNANEGELFIPPVVNTCVDYTLDVTNRFGALAAQVLALYPCLGYTLPRWAEVDVVTDAVFTCPARRVARAVAASQSRPVFRYYYTHGYKLSALIAMRAFHSAELAFVFQTFGVLAYPASTAEVKLSDTLQGYWARLAAAGDPAGTGAPAWPAYVPATDNVLVLDETIAPDAAIKAKQCDFWDSLSE